MGPGGYGQAQMGAGGQPGMMGGQQQQQQQQQPAWGGAPVQQGAPMMVSGGPGAWRGGWRGAENAAGVHGAERACKQRHPGAFCCIAQCCVSRFAHTAPGAATSAWNAACCCACCALQGGGYGGGAGGGAQQQWGAPVQQQQQQQPQQPAFNPMAAGWM